MSEIDPKKLSKEQQAKTFDSLPDSVKVQWMMPRMTVMVELLRDIKLNMDNFWIKNGTMTKDSIFYTEFMKKYDYLFNGGEQKCPSQDLSIPKKKQKNGP